MSARFYNLNPQFYLSIFTQNKATKKSPFDFKRSLKKALFGNHQYFILDESFLKDKKQEHYFEKTLETGLKPVLQLTVSGFYHYNSQLKLMRDKYKQSILFNIIFDDVKQLTLNDLKSFLPQMFFSYVVTKKNRRESFKQKLPKEIIDKMECLFPYKESFFDPFLKASQVYKFIKKQGAVSPYSSEIYDYRIAEDMDLGPCTLPFAENKIPSSKKATFSIIIPSYNRKKQLINTLKYLSQQNYPRDEYEIILVDDGSTDNTRSAVRNFMKQYPSLQMKAIHFPRVLEKKIFSARFRAGLARNLGSRYSEGEILAFLDSDILVPPDYLQQLKKEHESADLILLKRHHLKEKTPIEDLFFNQTKLKEKNYIIKDSYWDNFYKKGFDQVKTPWKYVCTYGLSLRKKDFEELGAFGKNFIFYGFEDTDLGYRMLKKNKKLLLSKIDVYHQAPTKNQEKLNIFLRHKLLSKTAKILFYKHLDPEIYEEMISYMTQHRGLYYFFPFLKNLFN